nr:L,D-transpeptidase family protein [uncultured Peptostreptococcus sp.]
MSRVERKRLEKEAKKNKKTRFFKFSEKEIENRDISLELDESSNLSIKIDDDKDERVTIDSVGGGVEDRKPSNQNFDNKQDFKYEQKSKNRSKLGYMKTADRIISVEDEEMRLKRRQAYLREHHASDIESQPLMTVDDIMTEEDISRGVYDYKPEKGLDTSQDSDININQIKHIDIERAPFEDVVRVAESRLAAEKLKHEEYKREEEKILKQEQIKKEVIEKELREREKLKTQQLNLDMAKGDEPKSQLFSRKKGGFKKKMSDKEKEETKDTVGEVKAEEIKAEETKAEETKTEETKAEEIKAEEIKAEDIKIQENNIKQGSLAESSFQQEVMHEPKKGGFKKFFKRLCIILIAIIALIYLAGCLVFKDRYFVNTSINGIKADLKTAAEIDKLAAEKIVNYRLDILGRKDVKDSISGKDVDMEYVKDGSAAKIKAEQGFFAWPIAFFQKEDINGKLNIKYDNVKLNDLVKKFNVFDKKNIKEPVSAFPRYDEKKGDYVVDKGDLGSTPIEVSIKNFVATSIKAEARKVEYPASAYKSQKNKADDKRIDKAISQLKEYDRVKVVYDFEKEKYIADTKDISKMFDVASEVDYKVELSKDKVREFVRSLSRKYSTYGDPREIPSASTGGKLKVTGGVYGWLIDREKETDYLYELVKAKKSENNRKPIYAQTAISRENNDMGNEFIEIDLSKQHMWFVRDGKVLVETPIVSGNPNQGDATPPGIYPLNYKTRHAILRGPGYASPVSYWMPFNGNIGIHDASWQPAYGGSRYLYAGSHGCINTPYSKVAQFYALSKEGIPVVVHH